MKLVLTGCGSNPRGSDSDQAILQVLVVDIMHRREISKRQILKQLVRSSLPMRSASLVQQYVAMSSPEGADPGMLTPYDG